MSRLYPCAYCTEDGYCKKYSDEEVTSWCVQSPCKDERPSNADRIRAMTDEELAEWFVKVQDDIADYYDKGHSIAPEMPTFKENWLDWLRQEVSDA